MKAYIVEIKLMVFTGRGRKLVDAKREPGLAFLRLGPLAFVVQRYLDDPRYDR